MNKNVSPRHCERSAAIQSNKTATKFATIILTLLLLFPLTSCKKEEANTNQKPTIKIGALLPLSKSMALSGNTFKELYQMRISEVPEDSKYNYELVVEDDSFEARKSIMASQKLINIDKIDVLFTSASGAEQTLADLTQKNNFLLFSYLWSEDVPKSSPYAFNLTYLPDQFIPILLEEMQKRGVKRVSTIIANHRGMIMCVEEFKKLAPKYGIEVLEDQRVNLEETDFKTLVYKMNEKKPDMYLMGLMPGYMVAWKKEIDLQGIKTPITSINNFDFETNKEYFNGSWYASDSLINPSFEDKYKNFYGKDLIFTQALFGYAMLDWIINIYETSEANLTVDDVAKKIAGQSRKGSLVGDVSMTNDGILQGRPILKIIKDGQMVLLEEN